MDGISEPEIIADAGHEPNRPRSPFKPWFLIAAAGALTLCVSWFSPWPWLAFAGVIGGVSGYFIGRALPSRSVVDVVCIDLEAGRIRVLEMGQGFFSRVNKIGRPYITIESGLGSNVIIARSYDDGTGTLVYPEDAEFSDAALLSMPSKYREMIDTIVELRTAVADQSMEIELRAQEVAAGLVARFDAQLKAVMRPEAPETPEAE